MPADPDSTSLWSWANCWQSESLYTPLPKGRKQNTESALWGLRENKCDENSACHHPFLSPLPLCAALVLLRELDVLNSLTCFRPTVLLLLSFWSQCSQDVAFPAKIFLSHWGGFLLRIVCFIPPQNSGVLGSVFGFCIYFSISVVSMWTTLSNSDSLTLCGISPVLSNELIVTHSTGPSAAPPPPFLLFFLGSPGPFPGPPLAGHRLCLWHTPIHASLPWIAQTERWGWSSLNSPLRTGHKVKGYSRYSAVLSHFPGTTPDPGQGTEWMLVRCLLIEYFLNLVHCVLLLHHSWHPLSCSQLP